MSGESEHSAVKLAVVELVSAIDYCTLEEINTAVDWVNKSANNDYSVSMSRRALYKKLLPVLRKIKREF